MNKRRRRRRIRKKKLMDWQKMVREELREEMREKEGDSVEAYTGTMESHHRY